MRLETVAKNVAEKLKVATMSKQREAGLVACEIALLAAPIENPTVLDAVAQLRDKGRLTDEILASLNGLTDQLDQKYFDLQEEAESDPDIQPEYLHFFGQARAVSALAFAGGADSLTAAMEAIYEASATVDDSQKIYDAVLLALSDE